jgi:hypothetical protein
MTNTETQQLTHYTVQEPVERFYDVCAYLAGADHAREICLVTREGYDVEILGVDLRGNRPEMFESWVDDVRHMMASTPHLRHLINEPLYLI